MKDLKLTYKKMATSNTNLATCGTSRSPAPPPHGDGDPLPYFKTLFIKMNKTYGTITNIWIKYTYKLHIQVIKISLVCCRDVACTLKLLPLTIAREILCHSHEISLVSPDASLALPPISLMMRSVPAPHDPMVSNATGSNWNLSTRSLYLFFFLSSAATAAAPASTADRLILDAAKVSTTGTSHTMHFSCLKGNVVIPSGLFPSPLSTPTDSKSAGSPAAPRVRFKMVFISACLGKRPALSLHDRAW